MNQLLINSITYAILYGLIGGVFVFIIKKYHNRIVNNIIEEQEKINKKYDDLTERHKILNKNSKKYKLLLLSRLRDYSKELSFWKDTIRKIMYKTSDKKDMSKELFDIITKNLKTFSTKNDNEVDYKMVEVLSKILKDDESQE
jgi:hypothetical protein